MPTAPNASDPSNTATADTTQTELLAKKALRSFAWVCGVACFAVLGFNIVVNPLAYFPTRWFRPLTWSSRAAKSERMAVAPPAQVLVLGSSRVMQLSPTEIQRVSSHTAYNAAVDSAKAEDWLAITRYAINDLRWPLTDIVLGVDVEGMHNHTPPDGRLGSAPKLVRNLPPSFQLRLLGEVVTSGLSQDQLSSSLRSLRLRRSGYPEETSALDPDGMLHYLKFAREIANGTFHPEFAGTALAYDGRFAGMTRIGDDREYALRSLLTLAQQRNVRVHAFVSPLHHTVVTHLNTHRDFGRLRQEVMTLLRQLKSEFAQNITVSDYTDVTAFGGDPELFYDGAHIREANADRLVQSLWSTDAVQ